MRNGIKYNGIKRNNIILKRVLLNYFSHYHVSVIMEIKMTFPWNHGML